MKRILLLMNQPPGCSSVQGLRYSKLLPYLEDLGWEFHFCGPSPRKCSVLIEPLRYPSERLHYSGRVLRSIEYSVCKNRQKRFSPAFLFYGALQWVSRLVERQLKQDPFNHMEAGLVHKAMEADRLYDFDLIAGKSPDFRMLLTAARLCRQLGKPFLAIYDDPEGARDQGGFYPSDPELQKAVLDQSCGAIFMSPLTRERYVGCGLVADEFSYALCDSYPEPAELRRSGGHRHEIPALQDLPLGAYAPDPMRLVHLGSLPEWRPVDSFLEALRRFRRSSPEVRLIIETYGYVYGAARSTIEADQDLASMFRFHPGVSHDESHEVAAGCDIQLVIIGPRHIDNQPSKFFVYLGHHKPVLAIGPRGNPIEKIIGRLEIGVYCDVDNAQSIFEGLSELRRDYCRYKSNFVNNHAALASYSAPQVAQQWVRCLDDMVATVQHKDQPGRCLSQ
ncbi:hypothetical protein NZK33_11705 [Cyanobium sp. FGCU-6]|nr:hypothetical protein [Cyanobium sp. FGCU6]